MQFKKLVFASILVLIPAQSFAMSTTAETVANKALGLMKRPEIIGVGGFAALVAGIGSYCVYNEYRKKKTAKDFWNKKSDAKILKLAAAFMQDIEKRLAPQLEKLRTASPSIKANLATLHFVCDSIETCEIWLERLTTRSLFACAQKIKDLESELKQLRNEMDIFVNNDFIKQFETLSNKVRNQPPVIIALPPYSYGYNYCQ